MVEGIQVEGKKNQTKKYLALNSKICSIYKRYQMAKIFSLLQRQGPRKKVSRQISDLSTG